MKVLLAEDSVLLREGLTGLLRALGHEVVAVGDADQLLDTAE
ncbi:response regulator, partial [Corynebacterium sp.]